MMSAVLALVIMSFSAGSRTAKIAISVSVARHIWCKAFQTPVGNGTLLDGSCRFSNEQGPIRQLGSLGCWSENVVVSEECCVPINRSIPSKLLHFLVVQ